MGIPKYELNRNIGGGGAGQAHIAVGEEQLIGEWVEDGVTYDYLMKVVPLGNLPNNNFKEVEHGVTNKVRFVNTYGAAYGNNNLSLPFVNGNGTLFIYMGVGGKKINIQTNSDRSNLIGYAYLYFIRTKS